MRLRIAIRGEAVAPGRLTLSELARIAGEIQAGVERVALVLTVGSSTGPGRRPGDVVDATQLDVVGLEPGSTVLEVEPHDAHPSLFTDDEPLIDRAVKCLLSGIAEIRARPEVMPTGFDRGVVNGLAQLTGGIGGEISSIELGLEGQTPVVLDDWARRAVREARRRLSREEVEITGRLHMGDFAPGTLRCRIDTAEGSVPCDFDSELRESVLSAMDRLVLAAGTAEFWPGESHIQVLHLEGLEVVEEARDPTLDAIIARQGVRPVDGIDELVVSPIENYEDFLAAIREIRAR